MLGSLARPAVLILLGGVLVSAADIEGSIVIRRVLTKKRVTAAAPAYERGVAVEPAGKSAEDPLSFERSHVAVYLEGDLPSNPLSVTMEQRGRRFLPDLVVIPAGSTVSFPNLDPIFHNVFSLSKARSFDLGNYPQDETRKVTFSKPGVVFVNCHLHPNMSAAIVVGPNRWATRAAPSGHFVLKGVPPGTHTVVAWHKTAGFFRQTVRVQEGVKSAVEFVIPVDENGMPVITAGASR